MIASIRPVGKVEVYKLMEDNDTELDGRLYRKSAVSATSFGQFIKKEVDNYYVACRYKQKALRPLIVDNNLTLNDWEVLKAYHEVL